MSVSWALFQIMFHGKFLFLCIDYIRTHMRWTACIIDKLPKYPTKTDRVQCGYCNTTVQVIGITGNSIAWCLSMSYCPHSPFHRLVFNVMTVAFKGKFYCRKFATVLVIIVYCRKAPCGIYKKRSSRLSKKIRLSFISQWKLWSNS